MTNYINHSEILSFSYKGRSASQFAPAILKSIDTRIGNLVFRDKINSIRVLSEIKNIKNQLKCLAKRLDSEQVLLRNTQAINPQTKKIQGNLSSYQKRWLKYFSIDQMDSEAIEQFNLMNRPDSSTEQIEIDRLLHVTEAIKALYSNCYGNRMNGSSKRNLEKNPILLNYRDRYSLSHTSVFQLGLVQIKLIVEDLIFLLTGLIKSLYFLTLSQKIRLQLLNIRFIASQFFKRLEHAEKPNASIWTQRLAKAGGEKNRLADLKLDKTGEELYLRLIGQLNLTHKTIKLIKMRNSEFWRKISVKAQAKVKLSAATQRATAKKSGRPIGWREKLRWDMASNIAPLTDAHSYSISSHSQLSERYNQLMFHVDTLETAIQTAISQLKGHLPQKGRWVENEVSNRFANYDVNDPWSSGR